MTYPPDFEAFWDAYPKRKAKADALKAWRQTAEARPDLDTLICSVRAQWVSEWQFDESRFIPHPATWLRAHRWEDDLEWRDWLADATEDERLAELADFGALTPEQLADWRKRAAAREAGEREQAALRARVREGARLVEAGEVEDLDEWLKGQEVEN